MATEQEIRKSEAARLSNARHVANDASEFSHSYDPSAPPVGLDMDGHDTALMGPKVVIVDAFVIDLLNVDTSAQTFQLKVRLNMDWEDDGTIEPETKAKRMMGGRDGGDGQGVYRTGKYALRSEVREDPLALTWNPEVVLVNAMADEDPIEAGSIFHSVQILHGRPVISRSALYQTECRCAFTFDNFPFDETDLVVKFSSNKWSAEEVDFLWSHRLRAVEGKASRRGIRRQSSVLTRSVDSAAIGGIGLSEFEIVQVRVETEEKDVNSMQRYDNAQGAFGQAHLVIRVRRDPYSYLFRVATVAELLMLLEVLSFLTDTGDGDSTVDLPARFSISGTIFLAMVSLYGPMADSLPKVSVVTRVDNWHLYNFMLLFCSNLENLVAFLLRNVISIKVMEYAEALLAILYLVLVVRNLIWFLKPLNEREDFTKMLLLWEDRMDEFKNKYLGLAGRVAWREVRAKAREIWTTAREKLIALMPKKKEEPNSGEQLVEKLLKLDERLRQATDEGVPHPLRVGKKVTIEVPPSMTAPDGDSLTLQSPSVRAALLARGAGAAPSGTAPVSSESTHLVEAEPESKHFVEEESESTHLVKKEPERPAGKGPRQRFKRMGRMKKDDAEEWPREKAQNQSNKFTTRD